MKGQQVSDLNVESHPVSEPDHLIKPGLHTKTPIFVRGEGVELIDDEGRRGGRGNALPQSARENRNNPKNHVPLRGVPP